MILLRSTVRFLIWHSIIGIAPGRCSCSDIKLAFHSNRTVCLLVETWGNIPRQLSYIVIHVIATTGVCFSSRLPKDVGKGGGKGGLKPHQILSSCYYVYKQLPQKDVQNFEKQARKKQISDYKLASFPGHFQILSHSHESGSGLGMRLVTSSVTHTKIKA